jgi:hypothetical protein
MKNVQQCVLWLDTNTKNAEQLNDQMSKQIIICRKELHTCYNGNNCAVGMCSDFLCTIWYYTV